MISKHYFASICTLILYVTFTSACSPEKENVSGLDTIDLDELIQDDNSISLTEILEIERIIPLETSEYTFMKFPKLDQILGDSIFVIKPNKKILLFKVENGTLHSTLAKKEMHQRTFIVP